MLCKSIFYCLRSYSEWSHCHYVNKSCMIPGYIISPLWNIFTNDEMLLLSVSDIQSLSVSFLTALVIQADLGHLQGENFQYKVKWTKFLSNYCSTIFFPFHQVSQTLALLPKGCRKRSNRNIILLRS